MLIGEVNNGGLNQYFFNSSGDHTQAALDGLRELGTTNAELNFRSAVGAFGKTGPAKERTARIEQLAKFSFRADRLLAELSEKFSKDSEQFRLRLLIYAAQNAEHFHKRVESTPSQ